MCLLGAMSCSSFVNAQALSLAEAQQTAEQHSPTLSEMQIDVNIAEASMDKTFAPRLPQIYVKGRHLLDDKPQVMEVSGRPFSLVQPGSDYSVGVSLLLYDGKGTRSKVEASKYQHAASTARLDQARFKLDEEVRVKFYQALGARELVKVSSQNVEVLKAHLRDVQNQIKLGVATRLDVLKVEVQLEEAQNAQDAAEDNAILAQAKLVQMMGIEQFSGSLKGQLPTLSRKEYDKIDFTRGERLDQKALLYMKQSAENAVRASHAASSPKVTLFGQKDLYSYTSQSFLPNNKFHDAYTVGLNFSWSLYDGGATSAGERIANEKLRKQEEEIRRAKQAMPVDIDFWKRKLAHDIARYQAGRRSTEKSEEAVRLAKNAMRLGSRTNTDVLDAEQDLNFSKSKIVKAQMDAVVSLSNLELALGKRIAIFGFE